jgi:hypothetical protein
LTNKKKKIRILFNGINQFKRIEIGIGDKKSILIHRLGENKIQVI